MAARSRSLWERRRSLMPRLRFPPELPVSQRRDEIRRLLIEHQVLVVCGETGSGKTTQLPKICLDAGRGVAGMIGHTQPRRIAARGVAARIAEELGSATGRLVGYKVRFTDDTSDDCLVKVMTDGILLAEIQSDRLLERYDTIIIDEAHERSLNIDFLLGYLRQLLPRRPDLKLIITSATIDPQRFSRHFGDAPVVEVSGRTYPVEIRYRPIETAEGEEEPDVINAVVETTQQLAGEGSGDILVFLPGEREIRETAEALRDRHPRQTQVLPLYARLSADEQARIFQPHPGRRIVLATNVAETSLTVPGIRFVVDSGLARVSRYSPRSKVQRLPVEPISQASAQQRSGRCGRIGPGVCVRLYSESDFLARPAFTEPEILRTNLAGVILRMKFLGLGEVGTFAFIDPPDGRQVRDGLQTLTEIGAIDAKQELTPLGRRLARLPVDPRVGRMILAGMEENCLEEVLIVAAALSVQDPRERPLDQAALADASHARFRDERSDFLSYLKLWDWFHEQAVHVSGNRLRRLCRDSFISCVRMREWKDVHHQLKSMVSEMEPASPRSARAGEAGGHERSGRL